MAGCALNRGAPGTQFAGLTVTLDPSLRQPCSHPALPSPQIDPITGRLTASVGAIETFADRADVAIEACEARRAAIVSILDDHNALVRQASDKIARRRLWPF